MTSFFGPRRRNSQIRKLLMAGVLIVLAFIAYRVLMNSNSSDETSTTVMVENTSVTPTTMTTETPIATPTPNDPNYMILTREYEWLVPSIEVMELQELLEIEKDY